MFENVVDQTLRILGLERDDARELPLEVRIIRVEPVRYEIGVRLVLGKEDGLAEPIASGDLQTARHQVREDLVDRVFIEQPLVDGLGLHSIGDVPFFVPLERVPLVFVLL